jgi:RNA polymerase sigma-70 factor, ECF subfamily
MENTISKLDFNKVYNDYKPVVEKVVRMRIKCEATVEDITADVFEKVLKHLHTYDINKSKFNTWLITVTHNSIIDHFRKEHSTRFISVDNFVNGQDEKVDTANFFIEPESTDKGIDQRELKTRLSNVFATLKPKHKEIAVMYFKQNLQYTDIANVLEIPLNTVKVTILRIREVLQSALKAEYQLINE